MKKIFTVQLLDKEFTLTTSEPPEQLNKVVNMVNDYLEKMKVRYPYKDRATLSLLTALNIASDYWDEKQNRELFENKIAALIELIDRNLREDACGVRDQ